MPTTRRISIIGAGPAGLCAARECLKHYTSPPSSPPLQVEIVVYEQRSVLGGVWSAENDGSTDAEKCTGMYANLVTNIPKEIVFFDDQPTYPHHDPNTEKSFIPRQQMLDYFAEYARPIVGLIRYNTRVVDVSRVGEDKWRVVIERTEGAEHVGPSDESSSSSDFDAVFVCNGHHNEPRVPAFAAKYKRPAVHSKFYRRAEEYRDCTVAVVGAGPSGLDLTVQLSNVAKKVYLLHRRPSPDNSTFGPLPMNCVEGSTVIDATEDALILADGSQLSGLDHVIYCTGYNYSFPFFRSQAAADGGGNERPLVATPDNATRVSGPLYAHVTHADHLDSLFFIGLNFKFLPTLVIQWQVRLAIALMTHRVALSRDDAVNFERDRLAKLAARGAPAKLYHQLADEIFDYVDHLVSLCGAMGEDGRAYTPVLKAIREHVFANLRSNFKDFKSLKYTVINDEEFIVSTAE